MEPMQGFDTANPPFDRLTHQEIEELTAALDIGYFAPGEVIVRQGGSSECLHVIIKGAVEGRDGESSRPCSARRTASTRAPSSTGPPARTSSRPKRRSAISSRADLILQPDPPQSRLRGVLLCGVSRKLDAFAGSARRRAWRAFCGRGCATYRIGAAVFVDGGISIEHAGHACATTTSTRSSSAMAIASASSPA